jgi:gas vesicle protein GvpO/gas vesicle protein GvpG
MDLLLLTIGLPFAPVRAVIGIAEILRREAESELYDPADVRHQVEETDRAVEAGEMSREDANQAQTEAIARLVAPTAGSATTDTEPSAGGDRRTIEGVITMPAGRTSNKTDARGEQRERRRQPGDEPYDERGSINEETDRDDDDLPDRERGYDEDGYDEDGTYEDDEGDNEPPPPPPKKRTRPARQSNRMPAAEASADGLDQIASMTGKEATGVTSIAPTDDGWLVEVEVIEDRRVPSTSDVLALYEVELGGDGALLSYRRTRRYARGHTDS